jgi:alkanesulfonate monooxygenase SsuD/methylene tetrahydromethanopterin reductase-like flavin-dependent oxidoreductase (luciferase family)
MWLLSAGSNATSGSLAAEKGMGLAVALFINPEASTEAVRHYRENFRPSKEFPEPRVMIAVNAVIAATTEKLQEQKKTSDFLRIMRDSGRYPASVPAPEAMTRVQFGANEKSHLERIANREVVGLPSEAKKQVLERVKKYEADEVMLTMITHKLADKIESFRLLAEVFGLK